MEIKILPVGKSLDTCAEMREKGKLRRAPGEGTGQKRRRRRRKRKLEEATGIGEVCAQLCGCFVYICYLYDCVNGLCVCVLLNFFYEGREGGCV